MKRILTVLLPLALAACGDDEAFTIEIAGSPGSNAVSLAAPDLSLASDELTGFRVNTDIGEGNVVTYTMPVVDRPGHRAGEATIELRLEPVAGKSATLVHARLDVPPTRIMMGKSGQVVSEAKVAAQLQRALTAGDRGTALGALLTSVAIASNVDLQAQVNGALASGASAYRPRELLDDGGGESDWGGSEPEREMAAEAPDPGDIPEPEFDIDDV